MTTEAKTLDLEQERQQALDEMTAEEGEGWLELYKPGSVGCHELLDRTAVIADMLERHILWHPASIANREWFALSEQALTALQELYQRISDAHLTVENDDDDSTRS